MAKVKPVTISDFSPGLQTLADPAELPVGAAQVCQDVMLDRGDLRVRDGRVIHCAIPGYTTPLTSPVRAIGELYMAGHSPEHRFIGIILNAAGSHCDIYWNVTSTSATAWTANTAYAKGQVIRAVTNTPTGATSYVYECTTAGTSHAATEPTWTITEGGTTSDGTVTWTCRFTDMWQEIDSSYSVHATNHISMEQHGAYLYIADGSNYARQLDADGAFTVLDDLLGPTTAPEIAAVTTDLILDRCDNSSAKTALDAGYLKQGIKRQGGGFANDAANVTQWFAFTANTDWPDAGDVEKIYAVAQTTDVYTGDGLSRTHSMALFVDAASGHTAHLDCGDVYLMRELDAVLAFTPEGVVVGGHDLSTATNVNFFMRVQADEMLGTAGGSCNLYLVLGEEARTNDTAPNWQKVAITADINGTALADLAVETWNEFSVDITGLSDSAINNVRWAGFFFENLDIIPETTPVATTDEYVRIAFSPLTANLTSSSFVQDDYEISYTFFDTSEGEESSEYIDPTNLAKIYPSYTINANIPQALRITCTRPIGSLANYGYVYARGGVQAGDMKKIGSVDFDNGTGGGDTTAVREVSLNWNGDYASDAALLPQYIGAPPKACTLLTVYRNRMLYIGRLPRLEWTAATVKAIGDDVIAHTSNNYVYYCTTAGTTGDTEPSWGTTVGGTTTDNTVTWTCANLDAADVLYYSNYGDPARVPKVPFSLAQNPVSFGGWADIERWGNNATGLLAAGPFAYIWKTGRVFRIQGDPGITGDAPDVFYIQQLPTDEGCISPNSPCRVGSKVCWQGRDKILSLGANDNEPVSLTDSITPTMQAYSSTKQGLAFSVYDTATKRFYMFYPSGSYGTSPNSEALVLSLKGEGSGWTQWTAQPGACGIYSAYASTPGVYIADAYGTSGRGKVFRLSSTAVTDALSYGAAAAIGWQWVSGAIVPFDGYYCQVDAVRGSLVMADTASTYTLATTLWLNNDDGRTKTRNLTVTRKIGFGDESQGTGVVDWTLAPHGEVEGVALKLARNDANIVAVRNVTLVLRPVAPVRGRTVARG
jgi:hypothetical protein